MERIMENDLFHGIVGKKITVCGLEVDNSEGKLCVKITCVCEKHKYLVAFENVSRINLSEVSYPFEICGFEILDFHSRGYQSDSRFFVNDYEDGKLSFFCEKYEIKLAKE